MTLHGALSRWDNATTFRARLFFSKMSIIEVCLAVCAIIVDNNALRNNNKYRIKSQWNVNWLTLIVSVYLARLFCRNS